MTDKPWEQARLIPVSGINGAEEQERRGTSALLAVINAVREFGRSIIGPLGCSGRDADGVHRGAVLAWG